MEIILVASAVYGLPPLSILAWHAFREASTESLQSRRWLAGLTIVVAVSILVFLISASASFVHSSSISGHPVWGAWNFPAVMARAALLAVFLGWLLKSPKPKAVIICSIALTVLLGNSPFFLAPGGDPLICLRQANGVCAPPPMNLVRDVLLGHEALFVLTSALGVIDAFAVLRTWRKTRGLKPVG